MLVRFLNETVKYSVNDEYVDLKMLGKGGKRVVIKWYRLKERWAVLGREQGNFVM